MSQSARLGAFILGALLILAFVIFRIGDKDFLFSSTYRLQAPFDNVAGLGNGSEVRLGGVRVGIVEMIQMPREAGGRVVVIMDLESSTQRLIRKDSVVAIQTEGLLGSKYVTISPGSPDAAEVKEGDTLRSEAPLDFSDLLKKTEGLLVSGQGILNNVEAVSTDMKSITAKIDRGEGTAGALINNREIYNQALEVVTDTRETVAQAKVRVTALLNNLEAASADMKSVTGKIDRGEGTAGALINNREIYDQARNTVADTREIVEQAKVGVVAFQENMEALKRNWLLRGFFRNRGYEDPSELTKHALEELPQRPVLQAFEFPAKDLFDKPDNAKLKNEKRLDRVGDFLEKTPYELVLVEASAGLKGETEDNLVLTQARALVIREYLVKHFNIDDTRVKTLGRGEDEQIRNDPSGRIEISVYSDRAGRTEGEARKEVSSIQPAKE
jgi:phospholipid/cholesterol/gamma-HCH transport system substrate-binding protein